MSSHDNTQIMNIKGATSVKYSGQQPGGNSTFSLGGGYGGDDDRFGNSGKVNAPAQKEEEEEKQEDVEDVPQQQTNEQPTQQAAGAASNAFTSVKYSGQPPGGKSNFTLG